MKKFVCLFPLFVTLTACGDGNTKEWYLQHDKERATRVAECRNDAKEQTSADCQNAMAAEAQVVTLGKDQTDYSIDLKLDKK
ncbi:EexN family lipoprotein [Pseudomonas soli]|jgi:hypothetical protein|uniref:EexN family lipoprotein n=1 Tax=Pseudomonas soli TaxID=1306993 RepID=UPI002894B53B|nr:EexN family lipoprotein [Pseudomonas soli]EKT4503699.1 EexN family lipoprotein [Pseudomonas putida]MDT3717852.1 EexN family lipoprotein [Pseudomonas soli]MDT3734565.1 EexN family lipoprotein [Pseudomonas soli]